MDSSKKKKKSTNGNGASVRGPGGQVLAPKTTILWVVETVYGCGNGDPARGGRPRQLPDLRGVLSRESTNSRIRKYRTMCHPGTVHLVHDGPALEEHVLALAEKSENAAIRAKAAEARAYVKKHKPADDEQDNGDGKKKKKSKIAPLEGTDAQTFRTELVKTYWDLSVIGGVLMTGSMPLNNVEPAVCTYDAITRYPVEMCDHTGSRTMAASINEPRDRTLWTREKVLYALYVGSSVTHPQNLAENGVSDEDLAFYVEALVKCWEHTNSGFRGVNNLRGLWVVRHKSPLGSCPDYLIQECLKIRCDDPSAASSYEDYEVSFDRALLEKRGLRVLDLDEVYDNWEAAVQ